MSVTCAPRARMAVKAAWPGVSMKVMAVALPVHLVGADVLGDATRLARHDVGRTDAVEQQRLAVVDVPHDGDDGRPRPLVGLVLLVVLLEVARQQLRLLLLAGVDQAHVGPDLGREQLDHVVAQRLGRHDHLALQEQEAHDVAGAPVELGPEVARRRAALDDDLALGNGGRRGLVRGQLRRLELLEVATPAASSALGRPPSGHAAASTLGRCTRRARPRRNGHRSRHRLAGHRSRHPWKGRFPRDGRHPRGAARSVAGRTRRAGRTDGAALGRRPPRPGGGGIGRPLGPMGGRGPGGGGTGLPEGLRGGRGERWGADGAAVSGACAAGD